jgi:hypothetical protein
MTQILITKENKVFNHFLTYKKWYLLFSTILLLAITPIRTLVSGDRLPLAPESYYHLVTESSLWHFLSISLPVSLLQIISLLLAGVAVFLFLSLAKRLKLSAPFTFFFLLFTIISPTFIYTFTVLSSYSILVVLLLLGFILLTFKKTWIRACAVFPFALVLFFDLTSIILQALLLAAFMLGEKKKRKTVPLFMLCMTVLLFLIAALYLHQPLVEGPFSSEELASGLLTDLGGVSGIGLFLLALGMIGITFTWKKKRFRTAYFILTLLIPLYIYNSHSVFLLSLIITLFATTGFLKLFRRKWILVYLKQFTFLVLLLGLMFSTLSYLDRLPEMGPTVEETAALQWMETNTDARAHVVSSVDNSYFIRYFAVRKPLVVPHIDNPILSRTNNAILQATYIDDLFPLLEEHRVSLIYLTPKMKQNLPKEYGLLFLLTNENFKLIYTHQGVEIWVFEKE